VLKRFIPENLLVTSCIIKVSGMNLYNTGSYKKVFWNEPL
jgi:hypothetical protein